LCKSTRHEFHSHSPFSNIRLLDAISTIEDLIQKSADMGLKGIAITDHETVAAHVKAIQKVRELKEKKKIPQDFKLTLGNEIYLVNSMEEVQDNYESGVTKFPHFLLLAKDIEAHEMLRGLSSQAWSQSFYTGAMERVPTTKAQLEEAIRSNPNKLVGSSACLGSESSIHILNGDFDKAKDFLKWCSNLFGKGNFFLEMQPAIGGEQRIVNEKLIEFSNELGIDLIITSDVHYLRPEDADIHSSYLNSKGGEREVAEFYSNTYLHTNEEIYEKLSYIDESIITKALENTLKIGEMIEEYTIEADIVIPKITLPEFTLRHLFKKGYKRYNYIYEMAHSENEQDRYLIHLIEEGFLEYIPYQSVSQEYFHTMMARINIELEQLWEISKVLNQAMSAYYVTVAKIVDLMWGDDCGEDSKTEGSLVGSGRGSAVAFFINYLTGITQVNPLVYGIEVPYWRHLSKDMPSISALDVDVDINGTKKHYIFERMKRFFGEDRFLQVCTFGTEGSKSAIQTACRGLGYDTDIAQYISSLIPFERGANWSIKDCLYGDVEEDRKPVREFIKEIEQYPKLKETALKIEGLVNKRSVHAGGVLIMNDSYVKTNAMMKSPKGVMTTQFNLDDSQALGNIKYDILTIEAMEKIQTTMDLLLKEKEMIWQGTLRKTFNKYLHPEIIDKENPKLFEMASSGTIPDLFQFSTAIGHSTIKKVQPKNLIEMVATNSLMRLQSEGMEQPIDTFIRFKNDISLWYDEMRKWGLDENEVKIMEEHLLPLNGVADTQESVMLMAMDKRVASFNVKESTTLRKSIAKKNKEIAITARDILMEKGFAQGTSEALLDYVWYQISRMLSYAFSSPHTLAYSLIAMEQLNLNMNYNPLYWNTAVLTVNSGSQEVEEGEKKKTTKYGKTASAIGKMKSFGVNVSLPLINSAGFGFETDIKNNRIIFSLKGIVGVGDDAVYEIINNRPYTSFDDFYDRLYLTKKVQKKHIIKLVKAGAFDEFGERIEIMKKLVFKEVDMKDKLTMANLPRAIEIGLLDGEKLEIYKRLIEFKKYISKSVVRTIPKPKDKILGLDNTAQVFLMEHFTDVKYEYEDNIMTISEKEFSKSYDIIMEPIKELINTKPFLNAFNKAQFIELWDDMASGTVSSWEMESVSFYDSEHELEHLDRDKYGIANWNEIDPIPEIVETYVSRGREYKNNRLFSLVGTVLDKDKNKHTVTILTPDGVVTCKMYGGAFTHYDKQISVVEGGKKRVVEKSWFTRGNLLFVTGFRREDQFVLKTYKNSPHAHTINLITGIEGTEVKLQSERTKG